MSKFNIGGEQVKYDLKAMEFDPNETKVDRAFWWDKTPEGEDYWSKFYYGWMTNSEEEVAEAKWAQMKKQWYKEQPNENPLKDAWDEFAILDTTALNNNVKHPSHYNQSGEVECIDAIKASLGKDGFAAYCKGNCMKYMWRYKYKNGLEDLEKAKVYLDWLIETLREEA